MECNVCCEYYNKSTRKTIECSFCNYKACFACTKMYLLDSFHKPHCMNCKREWLHEFTSTRLGTFMKTEYRDKRETLLFEREKSFIPSIMPLAEREKKIKLLSQHIHNVQNELSDWYDTFHLYRYNTDNYNEFKLEKRELKRTIRSLIEERISLSRSEVREERKTFVMKCIVSECKGFLSSRYKCGLCSIHVCKECHAVDSEEHKCNPDTVATITELKKSTKSCPSCQCPIYKTEGCDQMWCIQCHTAFSWKTGRIEAGIIHNPHYFEFVKNKGVLPRNPMDVVCGGLPDYRSVYEQCLADYYDQDKINYVRLVYEDMAHYRQDTLQRLPTEQEQVDHTDLLLRYVMDEITEDNLKSLLYVREQKRQRGLEERQIIDAYVSIGEEAFRKLVRNYSTFYEFLHETDEIKMYTYRGLMSLEQRYQHKGFISPNAFR